MNLKENKIVSNFMEIKPTLRAQWSITIIICCLFGIGIVSLTSISYTKFHLRNELKKRGKSLTVNLANNSEYGVFTKNKENLSLLVRNLFSSEDVVFCQVLSKKGKILSSKDNFNIPKNILKKLQEKLLKSSFLLEYEEVHLPRFILFSYPIFSDKGPERSEELRILMDYKTETEIEKKRAIKSSNSIIGFCFVGLSEARIITSLNNMKKTLGIIILLISATILVVIISIVKKMVTPLIYLKEATSRIAKC